MIAWRSMIDHRLGNDLELDAVIEPYVASTPGDRLR